MTFLELFAQIRYQTSTVTLPNDHMVDLSGPGEMCLGSLALL